jgi:hypothetical protein
VIGSELGDSKPIVSLRVSSRYALRYERYMLKRRRPECKRCKKPLEHHGGRPKTYCSAACRQAAYRRRPATQFTALRLLGKDIQIVMDRGERVRKLISELNALLRPQGQEVYVGPLRKKPEPRLSVVPRAQPSGSGKSMEGEEGTKDDKGPGGN